jgi:PAS domain S-box-containing protein
MAIDRHSLLRVLEPRSLICTAALAVCYFLAAKVSLLLATPPGYATAVWPPSGIAVAALLLYGVRVWPGVWLGALLANATITPSLGLAAAIATGNTLEATLGALLVQRLLDSQHEFPRAESVFRFAIVAALAAAVAATSGVSSLALMGQLPSGAWLENWYTWWLGDFTGIIVVAPLLLAWLGGRQQLRHSHPLEVVTFAGLFSFAFATIFVLGWWVGTDIARSLIFLLIPFMAWAGCRFDQRTVTASILVATGVAVSATMNNLSPFEFSSHNQALLTLLAFTSTVALMGLVLSALTRESREALDTLRRGSEQLEATVADRTQDLENTNRDLARDIAEKERLATGLALVERIRATQMRVTTALLDATSLEQAIRGAMRSLCEDLGWAIGQTWQVDPDAQILQLTSSWPTGESALVAHSLAVRPRRGEGLPGRCWQREAIVWVEDVLEDPEFLRKRGARDAGLRGAVAFPLVAGAEVLGVMEFFSHARETPQPELVHMLSAIGHQLGEYIVRSRAQLLLRQSEERFRVLVQGVKEYAIFMLEPDGRVATWNPGAERIKGYRAEEIIGVHFSRFFPPEDLLADKPDRELAAATRVGQVQAEGWRVRKDGSRFWASTLLTALHDENGRLRGFAKVTRDMSDRKRLEALEEAGRHTREFLATLAHELRNPLAPIRNAVSVMRMRTVVDPQLRACRDIVGRQVEHLARLVDDLFDLSRITTGKVALQRKPIDATSAVTHAVECVRPFIDVRKQTLQIGLPEAPIMIYGDLTRLSQVVQNLLHNAAKYTPPGGRIELSLRREADSAVIRVQDNGIGIAPELLPKVFDLFLQGEKSVDPADSGLGIGLTLVRELVELHGGRVSASSEGPGRGAEFVVRIPCLPASDVATLPPSTGVVSQAPGASEKRRILVVDDNRDSAESMALLLRLSGHQTWLAFDGPTAVSLAAEHSPDTVVLDIGLPGMDGYQVAAKLRELPQTSNSLLIALTGYGQEEDLRQAKAAGFSEHFVKPVNPESLFRAMERHRRGRPAEQPQ